MKKTPKLYNSISPSAVTAGWVYYGFEMLLLPSILMRIAAPLGLSDAVVNFIYYLLNFAFSCWIFRDFLAGSLDHAAKDMSHFLLAVALGFLGNWAVNYAAGLLMELVSPDFANVNDQAIAAMYADQPLLILLGTVLLVPVAEECLFRGLIFSQLQPKSKPLAYVISALTFCAAHVVGYVGVYPTATLAVCFAQYLPAGLLLAWAYERSGTILAPILIHTAVNAMAIFSFV